MFRRQRRQVLGLGASLALLAASLQAGQSAKPAPGTPTPDGRLRSELSLVARTAWVATAGDLRASDPAHKSFFASGAGGRLRIGQLMTNGELKFGDALSVGKPDQVGIKYDLWLLGTRDSWEMEITPDGAEGQATGRVPLTRLANAGSSPILVMSLLPSTRDTGQMVVRWGGVTAAATVQFHEVRIPAGAMSGRANEPINRKHNEENVAARFILLSQFNETGLMWPTGGRQSATFGRTFAKNQRAVSAAGTTARLGLTVEGSDFARLMTTPDGKFVELGDAAAPRLMIESALRFGKVTLKTGNQIPGYSGMYGLWLKRSGRGWRLVFNNESDAWGSQHDPQFDTAEIELTYAERGDATRPFGIALEPTGVDTGRLTIIWGPHEWSAPFALAK
jgi:hypothetical protein